MFSSTNRGKVLLQHVRQRLGRSVRASHDPTIAGTHPAPRAPKRLLQPLDDKERAVVDDFHRLYRDGRRIDKATYFRGTRVYKCPLDLWIYQELIHELRPDLVVETGSLHGGSAFFLGSMLDLAGHGEVMSIDIEARDERPRHPRVEYVTGSSISDVIVDRVKERARGLRSVLVMLDSDHHKRHVLAEMRAYCSVVTPGSYLIVEDTNINGNPVEETFGPGPMEAVQAFLAENDDFENDREREKFLLTFNPSGWLRKKP